METSGTRHFHDVLFSQASRKVMFGAPYGYLKMIGGWQAVNFVVWALETRRALRFRGRRLGD